MSQTLHCRKQLRLLLIKSVQISWRRRRFSTSRGDVSPKQSRCSDDRARVEWKKELATIGMIIRMPEKQVLRYPRIVGRIHCGSEIFFRFIRLFRAPGSVWW
jgi:hypothetical protein